MRRNGQIPPNQGNEYRSAIPQHELGLVTKKQVQEEELEERLRKQAKEELNQALAREDISIAEKNKIAQDLMIKETKRIAETKQKRKVDNYIDYVQLGVEGWKMRYYTNKFLVTDPNDVAEFV